MAPPLCIKRGYASGDQAEQHTTAKTAMHMASEARGALTTLSRVIVLERIVKQDAEGSSRIVPLRRTVHISYPWPQFPNATRHEKLPCLRDEPWRVPWTGVKGIWTDGIRLE